MLLVRAQLRHDIHRIRREVRQEVQHLIEDGEEDLEEWLRRRPAAVRQTFTTPDKDRPTQVLVLLDLLRRLDYPDITDDLTNGFDMVGRVRPGPGWRKRTDGLSTRCAAGTGNMRAAGC